MRLVYKCEHCGETHPKGNSYCPLFVEGEGIVKHPKTYVFSYKTCNRCHGTTRAINGAVTTPDGAKATYGTCKDCDGGNKFVFSRRAYYDPVNTAF